MSGPYPQEIHGNSFDLTTLILVVIVVAVFFVVIQLDSKKRDK